MKEHTFDALTLTETENNYSYIFSQVSRPPTRCKQKVEILNSNQPKSVGIMPPCGRGGSVIKHKKGQYLYIGLRAN